MQKRKILLVASVQSHICQFHRPLVEMLHKYGFEVHVAAHNNLDVKPGLKLDFADKVYEIPFARSITSKDNISAYKEIKSILNSEQFEAVHCNTPIASVITRLAAKEARRRGTKVIYTAHGFQFFKGSSKKDWVLYYPVEKIMSSFTDLIFTINREDYQVAKSFNCPHVQYIPGVGVDTEKFSNGQAINLSNEFDLPENAYFILSVGELFPRKNHKIIIDAMKNLRNYPIYYVICGNGILENELKQRCLDNGVEDKVIFAGYRRDIPDVMKSCGMFVFPSIREGLGLAGIEAMASGLPVISSNINGILDYMIEGKTGYLCDPEDSDLFAQRILYIYNNPDKAKEIASFNVQHAKEFDVSESVKAIENGYKMVLDF